MTLDLQNMVSETLERLGVKTGDDLLLALSGGTDSLVLLEILCRLQKSRSGRLIAAHLDHGVREAGSARDALSVAEICRKKGVTLITGLLRREEVREARARLRSMEAGLRALRYRFLRNIALEAGISWILTGHQADDQAETVLFRTLRGMDWRSLGGIREKETQILHPLLGVFRSELMEFCDAEGLIPLEDPSNLDIAYSRNKLRHRIIPGLERKFQEDISPLLLRMGEAARSLAEFESGILDRLTGNRLDLSVNYIDLNVLNRLPGGLIEGGAIRVLQSVAPGHPKRPQVKQLVKVIEKGEGKVKISGGHEIEIYRDRLVLCEGALDDAGRPGLFPEREWQVPGSVDIPELGVFLTASEIYYDGHRRFPAGPEVMVGKKRLKTPLFVRRRRPGDRFQPLGMECSKQLKRFLIDRKVPRGDRDKIPVVTDREGAIIWIGGIEVSQRIALVPGTPSHAYLLRLDLSVNKRPGDQNGRVI